MYSQRIGDSIWATPVAVGNRIYFAGRSGTTTVIEAGREFRVLAQNRLWIEADGPAASESKRGQEKSEPPRAGTAPNLPIQYAIAAVAGDMFIRTGDTLYCIRQAAAK